MPDLWGKFWRASGIGKFKGEVEPDIFDLGLSSHPKHDRDVKAARDGRGRVAQYTRSISWESLVFNGHWVREFNGKFKITGRLQITFCYDNYHNHD